MPHRPHPKVDRDIDTLRETILRMAQLAEAILDKSLAAVWERSPALASEVMQDDVEIDRLDVEIDGAVLRILALDAPVAHDQP
jgi:phosphate transport system protein